jgi:hypothetical protein
MKKPKPIDKSGYFRLLAERWYEGQIESRTFGYKKQFDNKMNKRNKK